MTNLKFLFKIIQQMYNDSEDKIQNDNFEKVVDDLLNRNIAQLSLKVEFEKLFEQAQKVSQKNLINILNYINFQDGIILLNFRHLKYGSAISIKAKPQPCFGNVLNCLWFDRKITNFKNYEFVNFIISDGYKLIFVKPELKTINEDGLTFILPEISYNINNRRVKRYPCKNINAEIIQSGGILCGKLLDFSSLSFLVEVSDILPQYSQNFALEPVVLIIFKENKEILYSGKCVITKQEFTNKNIKIVLKPLVDNIQIFKPKEIRSLRYKLFPSPSIVFKHPIIKKIITLKVEDLSGGGVCVEEFYEESVLLPGMIIPELEVEFTPGFKIRCKAQVVYRNIQETEDNKKVVRCGIAFLDLDIQDQVKLSSFLHQMKDEKSYVCNRVDLDALWEFFFETGFFYAEKYAFLHSNKDRIKELYKKLYLDNPHIARHFIYQDRGRILAHISMLRVYEKTWLFHHHASRSVNLKAGLLVLDQITRYVNDFYHMYSTHMNFVISYYRSTNKFPNRVFGGFAKDFKNPKGCSIDSFGYFHFRKDINITSESLNLSGWKLNETQIEDLLELESFYEYNSGGLMLDALDLKPEMINVDNLKLEYERIGFKRERKIFSLKKDNELVAVIMMIASDVGLNLSNLTNCIHIIVLNPELLNPNLLFHTLFLIAKDYEEEDIPVLIYPLNFFEIQPVSYEKIYNLWIISPKDGYSFLKHILRWNKHI